jgi:hypothetical protein
MRTSDTRHPGDATDLASPDAAGAAAPTEGQPPGAPPSVPAHALFQQSWWLDAVAPGGWSEVTVERGGEVVARLPFVVRGPRRMRVLTQPPLTPFLGPWVARRADAKQVTALGDEMELLAELEARLPAAAAFHQNFSPQVLGVLPFLWAGYRAGVRYTYRLEDLGSEQELWAGLGADIRGRIRKARKQGVSVRSDLSLDRFHRVLSKTFERQGIRPPDRVLLARIEAACAPRGARSILFACDEAERVHAVAYIVWGASSAYYLLGGADPELRGSGAQSLLLWEAVLRARTVTSAFDFEGSMLVPVERLFRHFGARQTPYLHVSRASRPAQIALAMRAGLKRLADGARRPTDGSPR